MEGNTYKETHTWRNMHSRRNTRMKKNIEQKKYTYAGKSLHRLGGNLRLIFLVVVLFESVFHLFAIPQAI